MKVVIYTFVLEGKARLALKALKYDCFRLLSLTLTCSCRADMKVLKPINSFYVAVEPPTHTCSATCDGSRDLLVDSLNREVEPPLALKASMRSATCVEVSNPPFL